MGLIATPFVYDRQREKGESAGNLSALPREEVDADILYLGDEKAASVHEGSNSGTDPVAGSSQAAGAEYEHSSPTEQRSSSLPQPNDPTVHGEQPSPANPVDIQRLFEDRAFEGQLLRFIAQRMDPPPRPDSPVYSEEDNPPTYRPV